MENDELIIQGAPKRSPMPNEAFINAEIVITSYSDTKGNMKYSINLRGNPNLAQAVGLCELAKRSLIEEYEAAYSEDEGDEEDDD